MPESPDAAAKAALRERASAARAALGPAVREAASRAICDRVASLPAWRAARTVALYAPLGAEVATGPIVRLAREAGKRLAWPRLDPAGRAMDFAECDPETLVEGPARALEPPPGAPAIPPESIDLVLVPGSAFDARGGRLGRGRGHYDATLARLRPGAFRVGLAFEAQVVAAVPREPHDVPLDAVVTETRVLGPAGTPGPG